MAVLAPEQNDALLINGSADGYAKVTANANYYPGCKAYISSGAKASLDLGTLAGGNLDTVIESIGSGGEGNLITVAAIGDSGLGIGVVIAKTSQNVITIHYESLVSTVGDVETAIGSFGTIAVKAGGTGATILDVATDDFAATALAGGVYSHECVITDLSGTQFVGLRFVDGALGTGPSYGRSSLIDYLQADASRLYQPMQPAPTDASFKKLPQA